MSAGTSMLTQELLLALWLYWSGHDGTSKTGAATLKLLTLELLNS